MAGDIPASPGVYALYREDDRRVYVGKANSLRDRIWRSHSGRGEVMTSSALRRNIAEHLGFATAADIKARRYQPTEEQRQAVRSRLDECNIGWIECDSSATALDLEAQLKSEFKPPLTKI